MLATLAKLLQVQLPHDASEQLPSAVKPTGATFIVPIWRRPWMLAGPDTYGSSMLEHLGFTNACRINRYPEFDAPAIVAMNADIVIGPSEPYPFTERHHGELERLGVPNAPVVYVDGQDLLWWGTRTSGALERLKKMVFERPSK
jgi:ABC-type Fe3+-hydroxamate transport system substrate-binding protein